MQSNWLAISPEVQVSVAHEALVRARQLIGAQAGLLAEQMENGLVPAMDGPDALRLLAMILSEEAEQAKAA